VPQGFCEYNYVILKDFIKVGLFGPNKHRYNIVMKGGQFYKFVRRRGNKKGASIIFDIDAIL